MDEDSTTNKQKPIICPSKRLYGLILDYHLYEQGGDKENPELANQTLEETTQLLNSHPDVLSTRIKDSMRIRNHYHENKKGMKMISKHVMVMDIEDYVCGFERLSDDDDLSEEQLEDRTAYLRERNGVWGAPLPLHCVSCLGSTKMLKLIAHKYPPASKEFVSQDKDYDRTPLYIAAREGYQDCVDILLEVNKDVAKIKGGEWNCLPLHAAVEADHLGCVKSIVRVYKEGATVGNEYGCLPLHRAANVGNVETVRYLLKVFKKGASVKNKHGDLPINEAVLGGPMLYRMLNEKEESDNHMKCVYELFDAHKAGAFEQHMNSPLTNALQFKDETMVATIMRGTGYSYSFREYTPPYLYEGCNQM